MLLISSARRRLRSDHSLAFVSHAVFVSARNPSSRSFWPSRSSFSASEAAGAVLAGLLQEGGLRSVELLVLRRHERVEIALRLLLSRDGLSAVVNERVEHVAKDVLDLTGARLVLLLEGRVL